MPPPIVTQRSKFSLTNDIPDNPIEDLDVVIPKDQHGAEGSKHYNVITETITKALDKKLGMSKHKIVTP